MTATPTELELGRWSSRCVATGLLSRPEFNACTVHRRFGLLSLLRHLRQTSAVRPVQDTVRGDAAFVHDAASRVHGVESCRTDVTDASMYAFGAAAMCIVAFTATDDFFVRWAALDDDGANAALTSVARQFAAVFVRLVETASAPSLRFPGGLADVYVCGYGVGAALAASTMSHLNANAGDRGAVRVLGVELYGCPAFCGRCEMSRLRAQQWWYSSCVHVRLAFCAAPRGCVGCAEPDFETVVMCAAAPFARGCLCMVWRRCAALLWRPAKRVSLDDYADCAAQATDSCGCRV